MKYIELLFVKNSEKASGAKFNVRYRRIDIQLNSRQINGTELYNLIKIFNSVVEKYGKLHPPIFIDLTDVEFSDKLTYITLECILFCMIEVYHFDILINISGEDTIASSGLQYSPILRLTRVKKAERSQFMTDFDFMLSKNHYRRRVRENNDKSYASQIFDDISYFVRNSAFGLKEDCIDEITGVIAELISNAIEHGEKECLIDVDISGGFISKDDIDSPNKEYFVLSLAVINFSDKCVGEDLKRKMSSNIIGSLPSRYSRISAALVNHRQYFDDNYFEEDFYNIAIFQNKISGRLDASKSVGTGMLKLVKALGDRSEGNNFFERVPAKDVIQTCDMYFPGVAYNLQFIMERSNDEEN